MNSFCLKPCFGLAILGLTGRAGLAASGLVSAVVVVATGAGFGAASAEAAPTVFSLVFFVTWRASLADGVFETDATTARAGELATPAGVEAAGAGRLAAGATASAALGAATILEEGGGAIVASPAEFAFTSVLVFNWFAFSSMATGFSDFVAAAATLVASTPLAAVSGAALFFTAFALLAVFAGAEPVGVAAFTGDLAVAGLFAEAALFARGVAATDGSFPRAPLSMAGLPAAAALPAALLFAGLLPAALLPAGLLPTAVRTRDAALALARAADFAGAAAVALAAADLEMSDLRAASALPGDFAVVRALVVVLALAVAAAALAETPVLVASAERLRAAAERVDFAGFVAVFFVAAFAAALLRPAVAAEDPDFLAAFLLDDDIRRTLPCSSRFGDGTVLPGPGPCAKLRRRLNKTRERLYGGTQMMY